MLGIGGGVGGLSNVSLLLSAARNNSRCASSQHDISLSYTRLLRLGLSSVRVLQLSADVASGHPSTTVSIACNKLRNGEHKSLQEGLHHSLCYLRPLLRRRWMRCSSWVVRNTL
jgi:hypothetical protein